MRIDTRLLAWIALLAVGCSSPPPQTSRYLLPLDVPAGAARVDAATSIGLGRVAVAPYLGGSGLVVETGSHEIRPARFHEWAEPLDAGLRRFLRTEVSKALGSEVLADTSQQSRWDTTIDVSVDRLHGDLTGEAHLAARWSVTRKDGASSNHRFAARQPLPREGYAGLVDAEVALLRQLADAIAQSLR